MIVNSYIYVAMRRYNRHSEKKKEIFSFNFLLCIFCNHKCNNVPFGNYGTYQPNTAGPIHIYVSSGGYPLHSLLLIGWISFVYICPDGEAHDGHDAVHCGII